MPAWGDLNLTLNRVIEEQRRREEEEKRKQEEAQRALQLQRAQERASQNEWVERERGFPTLNQLSNPPRVEEPDPRLSVQLYDPGTRYEAPEEYRPRDEPEIRSSAPRSPTRTTTLAPYEPNVAPIRGWEDWTGEKYAYGKAALLPPKAPEPEPEPLRAANAWTTAEPDWVKRYRYQDPRFPADYDSTTPLPLEKPERSWWDRYAKPFFEQQTPNPIPSRNVGVLQQDEARQNIRSYLTESPAYQEYERNASPTQPPGQAYQKTYEATEGLPEPLRILSGAGSGAFQGVSNAGDWFMRNVDAPTRTMITEPIPDVIQGLTGQRPPNQQRSTAPSVADLAMPAINMFNPYHPLGQQVLGTEVNGTGAATRVIADSYLDEVNRLIGIREKVGALPQRQQELVEGTQLLSISGSERWQEALDTLLNREEQLTDLRYQIDEAMQSGDMQRAAELGALYDQYSKQTVWDVVDDKRHWGSELLAGLILDPTNLIPGSLVGDAFQAARKARAAAKFVINANQMTDNLADGLRIAQPILDSLNAGSGGASWLDDIAMSFKAKDYTGGLKHLSWLFAPNSSTQVSGDVNSLFRAAFQLFGPLTDVADVRKVMDLWTNPQTVGQLVDGVPGLASDLANIVDERGVMRWGAGVVGNQDLARAYPIVTRLREQLNNMQSLKGATLRPAEFFAELGGLFTSGAREFHSVNAAALPFNAAKARAVRISANVGKIEYLSKNGKILGTGAEGVWTDVIASAKTLNEAKGGKIDLRKLPSMLSQVQRMVMNDMFLGLRPDNWIKNALGATSMLIGTDTYTFLPNKQMIADLALKFEGTAPTPGLYDLQTGVDVLGGDRNPNASSILGRIPGLGGFMEGAFNVPYGATEIRLPGNAAIPFGEESFRTRAFYVTFMRTLRQMWTEKVDSGFASGLQAIGIDPNLAKKFRDIAVEAGINGNRRTFGRKMREAVSGATIYPNLRSMGVVDELLPSATRDNINSLINLATPENLDDTLRKIRLNFQAQRRQAAQVLGTNPPPLGNASTEEQLAEATATVVANVTDAAKRAGIDPTQATEAAKAVTQTTINGLATLRTDIAARPSSPYVADMLADFFGDFEELRKAAFGKIDDASKRAIQQASPEGWAEKYYTTTEAWGVYADDLATLIDDYRGRMMGVAQGIPYQAKRGTWDRIARYLNLEEGGLQAQIGTALGKATPESAPEYEATIGAGRDLIFRRTATLMEVFGKYPSADNFDLLGETLSKLNEFGAAASAKIQTMHAGKMGQDAYNTARNRIQQQAIRDAADFIYNAAHTMASNGVPRATDEVVEAAVKQAESAVAKAAPTPTPPPAPSRPFAPTEGQKVYSSSGDGWTLMKRNANGSWEASADARAEWQTITPEDFSKGRFTAEKPSPPVSTFEPWKRRMPDWVAGKVGANASQPKVEAAMRQHYEAVKKALADGLPVPQEVVDDYPALVRQYRPPTPAPTGYLPIPLDRMTKREILEKWRLDLQGEPYSKFDLERRMTVEQLRDAVRKAGLDTPPTPAVSDVRANLQSQLAKAETQYQMTPGAAERPDPYWQWDEAMRSVPEAARSPYQVHGTSLNGLLDVLDNGIDPNRPFHSGPPVPGQFGVDSTRTRNPYLILSQPGQGVAKAQTVVVQGPAEATLPALRQQYPNTRFVTVDEAASFMRRGTPTPAPQAITLLDVRRAAGQAGINNKHLFNIINKEMGIQTQTLEGLTPDQLAEVLAQIEKRAKPATPVQPGGFFAETSEDLPIFSGAAPRAPEVPPAPPRPTQGQEGMFDLRPTMGTGEPTYAPKASTRPPESAAASRASGEAAALEEQRSAMRDLWDRDIASAVDGVPQLDAVVLRFTRNGIVNITGDFPYEDMLGRSAGGYRFETGADVEKFLQDYVAAGARAKAVQADLKDANRYKRLGEKKVREAVTPILTEAGFAPDDLAKMSRRELLNALEQVEGKGDDLDLGETYFTAGVVPIPGWQKFRDLWRRGRQTGNARVGTTGDAAQHVINTLDAAEAKVIDEVTRAVREGAPNTLTPQQRLRIIDLADRLSPEYDNMLATATEAGQKFADFAMLNFDNRMNIDSILAFILPYHYYWSRMPARALAVALQKPQMVNFYYENKRAIQGYNEQEGVPPRLEGTIPVYTFEDGTQLRWAAERYLNSAIPGAMYFQPNPFVEPEQAEGNPTAQWILNLMKYTPGLLPGYQLGMYRWLDEVAPRQDGRKWVDSWQMGDVAPLYRAYGEADKATGGALPGQLPEQGLLGTGDEFNPYRDGRGSVIVGMREKADPYTIYYAQQVEYNKMHNLPPSTHIPADYLKPAQELAAKGEQFAGKERLLTVGTSYVGMPLYLYTNEEDQWRKMQETYFALGYDENGNVAGSKEAQRGYIDENPILGPTFAKSSLIPAYKGTTPGQNAQFGQKSDAEDATYDKYAAEKETYIAANPGIDKKAFRAWENDWYKRRQEELDSIETRYPDAAINSSEDRYRGMNPKELNEAATENARRQAEKDTGTPPVYPGDSSSQAEKDKYFADKEKYDKGVEARLNELLGDMAWLDASVGGKLLDAPKENDDPRFKSSGSFGQPETPFGRLLAPQPATPYGPAPRPDAGRTLRVGPMTPLGKAPWQRTAEDVIKENAEKYYVPGEAALKDRFADESAAAQAEYDKGSPFWDEYQALGDDSAAKRQYLLDHPDFAKMYKDKYGAWWEKGSTGKGGSGTGGDWSGAWDEYHGLGDNTEAKRQYLLSHPEFAKMYAEKYGDWWTDYAARTPATYAPRSYSSGGGGGGSSSSDVQKQDIQLRLSSLGAPRTPEIRGWRPLPEAEMNWRQWASLIGPDRVKQWRGRG